MQSLEMKLDGEKLLVRHPGGVVVMLDFTDLSDRSDDAGGPAKPGCATSTIAEAIGASRSRRSAGAAYICGVKVAAKPAEKKPDADV